MTNGVKDGGDAVYDLWVEMLAGSFKLRAAGRRIGAVGKDGGGTWGLLRSLAANGPQTVPELARRRPVSRQHIQTLVNRLVAEDLVALVENPAHKRSRLVRLTTLGSTRFQALDAGIRAIADELVVGLDAGAVKDAVRIVAELNRRLAARFDEPPDG